MKIRKLFPVLLLFFFFISGINNNIFPQDKSVDKTPETRAKKITDKLQDKLNLSQPQYNDVYQSYVNYFAKVKEFKNNNPTETSDKKSVMKSYRQDLKAELKKSLNDDQIEKLKNFKKNKTEHKKIKGIKHKNRD
jgi:ABC-type dipeptide/oligopeptide/nickel transport system permease component